MPGSRIIALGHYQPEHVLTNDDLARMVDTSDDWIRQRTGIATRRVARDESVTDLAAAAGANALARAGLEPADIGLVVVATCSAIDRCPNIATQVAGRLAIPSAAGYDLNNGCAGFTTALATADHAIRDEAARHALVIGVEKMTDLVDWTDRSTCVLLGDGAGAAVLSADAAGFGGGAAGFGGGAAGFGGGAAGLGRDAAGSGGDADGLRANAAGLGANAAAAGGDAAAAGANTAAFGANTAALGAAAAGYGADATRRSAEISGRRAEGGGRVTLARGVGPVVWGSDPSRGDAIRLSDEWRPRFRQNGQTVFRWATTAMAPLAREACRRAGIATSDLEVIVTHQANLRIIESIVRQLDAPNAVVARDVIDSGNTSAASIPLALSKLVERGDVRTGAPALLLGFGGGLSWAGQVVACP